MFYAFVLFIFCVNTLSTYIHAFLSICGKVSLLISVMCYETLMNFLSSLGMSITYHAFVFGFYYSSLLLLAFRGYNVLFMFL